MYDRQAVAYPHIPSQATRTPSSPLSCYRLHPPSRDDIPYQQNHPNCHVISAAPYHHGKQHARLLSAGVREPTPKATTCRDNNSTCISPINPHSPPPGRQKIYTIQHLKDASVDSAIFVREPSSLLSFVHQMYHSTTVIFCHGEKRGRRGLPRVLSQGCHGLVADLSRTSRGGRHNGIWALPYNFTYSNVSAKRLFNC